MTHLKESHLKSRFPRIYETCLKYNVDITVDMVPIRPAAHYMMGGIRTDLKGQTNVPGLYAAGEAACTGVHGANRLASNSLLEGLVFGARAANAMRDSAKAQSSESAQSLPQPAGQSRNEADVEDFIHRIQEMMWSKVGIVRNRQGLQEAASQLESASTALPPNTNRRNCEALNIHTTASLIARSALARLESRGAHYRVDYPEHDDVKFKKHSVATRSAVRFI
jgi:L-aspartate oxidase